MCFESKLGCTPVFAQSSHAKFSAELPPLPVSCLSLPRTPEQTSLVRSVFDKSEWALLEHERSAVPSPVAVALVPLDKGKETHRADEGSVEGEKMFTLVDQKRLARKRGKLRWADEEPPVPRKSFSKKLLAPEAGNCTYLEDNASTISSTNTKKSRRSAQQRSQQARSEKALILGELAAHREASKQEAEIAALAMSKRQAIQRANWHKRDKELKEQLALYASEKQKETEKLQQVREQEEAESRKALLEHQQAEQKRQQKLRAAVEKYHQSIAEASKAAKKNEASLRAQEKIERIAQLKRDRKRLLAKGILPVKTPLSMDTISQWHQEKDDRRRNLNRKTACLPILPELLHRCIPFIDGGMGPSVAA